MGLLSIGKRRRLQRCAGPRGCFAVLAVDHRNNLRQALNPNDPDSVPDKALIVFKDDVIRALAPAATAVLLDPELGAAQVIKSGSLPGSAGLIVAIEQTGYDGDRFSRISRLLPGWSPERMERLGADGVKLLVYYHPDAPAASQIEVLVEEVAAGCMAADVPLFLEPLSYSAASSLPGLAAQGKSRLVVQTARRLTAIPGVDVLKAEFPIDVSAVSDEAAWADACRELTRASRVPWVLLSASVSYDTYLRQVVVAAQAGASGVAVGRAVWKEALGLQGAARRKFLDTVARERMERLAALCEALATPWIEYDNPGREGPER
jgi:tagatose 1,6-diphosphate aldolase